MLPVAVAVLTAAMAPAGALAGDGPAAPAVAPVAERGPEEKVAATEKVDRVEKPAPPGRVAPAEATAPEAPAPDSAPGPAAPELRVSEAPSSPAAASPAVSTPATSDAPRVARRQAQRSTGGGARSGSKARGRAARTGVVRSIPARPSRRGAARRSGRDRRGSRETREHTRRTAAKGAVAAARPGARRSRPGAAASRADRTPAPERRSVGLVSAAAGEIVAVVPDWVWAILTCLCLAVAALSRRTILLARRRRHEATRSCDATVRALAAAVEAKDPCTAGHLERVQRLGLLLAAQMVPSEADSREMAHGFLLHDVGKLAVPDAILNKPGRLDADEFAVMRSHAEAGAAILDGVPGLGRALDIVRHHHERWDGGGYPAGLAGEAIPLWARIFSVIDTLDAITSERPYAERRPLDEALTEIAAHAGSQFDPAVVRVLLRMDRAVIAAAIGVPVSESAPAPAVHARRLSVVGA